MADTTSAPDAQAAPDAQPQAGNPPAQAADAQQPQPGSADSEGAPDLAALQRELKEARKEAAGYRTKLRTYEDAEKTAAERTAERIAELERELATTQAARQEQRLQMASFTAARKLGFRNPEIAHRLLTSSEVEFAEDGSPRNVEALLTQIARSEPYLVNGTPDYGGGPRGTSPNVGGDMNSLIRRAGGRA